MVLLKKYANWLSDKTGFDCIAVDKADIETNTTIRCDSARWSNLCFRNFRIVFLKKHMEALRGKRLVVFCVVTSPYDKKQWNKYISIT